MEIHRLTIMQPNYDKILFNKIYHETEGLRNSLVFQIDARRYGVTSDIIKSWFDDKFMFVFNKYYGKIDNEVLKGYIINSLKTFKYRVLRNAYTKNNLYNDSIHIEDHENLINIIPVDDNMDSKKELLNLALSFLKKKLSKEAYTILDIELNPPPYIAFKLKSLNTKIPAKLIAEYLDLEVDSNSIAYINGLRKEISVIISKAKSYFENHPAM